MASAASPPPRMPPKERVRNLVADAIHDFGQRDRGLLGGTMPEKASEPLPLYAIDLAALGEPNGALQVHQVGWRSLLLTPLGGARSADVRETGGELDFGHFARGASVDRMVEAGGLLDEHLGDRDGKVGVIESDSLRLAALWDQPSGLVVPFLGLEARIMSSADFEAEVLNRAAAMRAARGEEDQRPQSDPA